ncbi:type IV pilus modification protein PilV [Acinetobacter sp. YH12099]|uniref:type IV pilus modification protein PilV n=1 Tax=Acinetobacter sp. YH12099 TaxID=2601088 RepID=UPI0015D3DBD3|nr:type IV pilus modification protein PilV [Acinetobacter sp. YH12099]
MNNRNIQQGVGMMEVLVSLLLLAIAVLGFVGLQLRAVDAANESLNKIQAMNIARDFAERIRINPYAFTLLDKNNALITNGSTKSAYVKAVEEYGALTTSHTWASCFGSSSCTSANMAIEDVKQVVDKANQQGMTMNILPCATSITTEEGGESTTSSTNLNSGRNCIYVAWDTTTATEGSGDNDCTLYGKLKDNSKCIVVETY